MTDSLTATAIPAHRHRGRTVIRRRHEARLVLSADARGADAPYAGRVFASAVRSLWDEPGVADPPGRGWRDWALVALVMVAALIEGILRADVPWRPVSTLVALGLAPVLLWRRTHPLVCVVVAFGAGMALGLASLLRGTPNVGLATMSFVLVLTYALVRWGSGRQIVTGLAVVAIAATIAVAADDNEPAEVYGGFAVLAATAAIGAALRYRAESARRAIDQARSQERVALARELHDAVAHHISAITVQAQAGRTVAALRPEAAVEALSIIESEAARTLAEMRAMVRVLRDGAPAAYGPRPCVADLMGLARTAPDPAIEVELAGNLDHIPPQIDTATYRIAQEALTNALRHARHASRVQINVTPSAGRLRLRVSDDGRIDPSRPAAPGFGLLGMTERVHLLGGTLRAGPRPEGGWAVDAELPMELPR